MGHGFTVNTPVLNELPTAPLITALTCAAGAVVFTAKVALVCPATTVMEAGTVASALLLASVTTVPPAGAGPARFTVPMDVLPPKTDVGESVKDETAGGLIVSAFVFVTPSVALIVATTCDAV